MFHTSFRTPDAVLDRPMRVLLSLTNARDAELLTDQLRDNDIVVVGPEDGDPLPRFDLCVVDPAQFRGLADDIEARRSEFGAVQLPVLLVLGPNDSERTAQRLGDHIDDAISVPTTSAVFQQRVTALLRLKRQSEQLALFGRAMDDATTGITIADAGGDQELWYVNDAFVEMTGYDREAALGRNCRFLQGPKTNPEPVRRVWEAIDAADPVSVELRNYRKDGTMFWNHLEIAPVYGESGVTHFVGFQQDITERVQQRQALRRYEEIVNAAGEPIYALDSELRFTLLNEAAVALSGHSESEILGSHVASVFGQDHADVLEAAVLDLVNNPTTERTIGTVVRDADRRMRRYQTTVAHLPTAEFEGVVCVSRDITEDREREARLSVLDRVLRHNLRNKLLVMLAQAEQIQQQDDALAINHSAATIERAGEELLALAETARKFRQTVDPSADDAVGPVDVGDRTCHAVEETRLAFGPTNIDADVPDSLWARAHDSFELAMTELLEQAANAGDGVTVAVDVTEDSDDGTVSITVSHDGASLTAVEREALNAGVESDLKHTTGLGLWFVRWMAINSGGTFHIADTDLGTRVELTLPSADPPETQ